MRFFSGLGRPVTWAAVTGSSALSSSPRNTTRDSLHDVIVANAINRAGDRDSRAATHEPVARLLLSSSHLVTQTLPAERDNGRVCVSLVKRRGGDRVKRSVPIVLFQHL